MDLWEILNSPLVITVLSFVLGGIVVAVVSAKMQQRAQRHSVRLANTQELLKIYHEYIRFLRGAKEAEDSGEFDRIHAELMSHARISKVLFDETTCNELERLAKRLANIRQLRKKEQFEHVQEQLDDAYHHAEQIFEDMFAELEGGRAILHGLSNSPGKIKLKKK